MADLSLLLTSLTTAGNAAKGLLDIKSIAESAEARMAIAEMQNVLADTKGELSDLKLELQSKDEVIRGLEEKLAERTKLVRHNEKFYEADENGKPVGDPYCPRCWEVDAMKVHLTYRNKTYVVCPACEKKFPKIPGQETQSVGVAKSRLNRRSRF